MHRKEHHLKGCWGLANAFEQAHLNESNAILGALKGIWRRTACWTRRCKVYNRTQVW